MTRRETCELAAEGGAVVVMLDHATGRARPIDGELLERMLPFCRLATP